MPQPPPTPWPIGTPLPPSGPVVALVPGEAAALMPVALPAALRGQARVAVARRQLADRLGAAAAGLELRPAALGVPADGFGAMLAVEAAALAGWRAAAAAAGRRVRALLPDYLALPAAPSVWVLAVRGARVCARLGPADGFAAEAGLAAAQLAEARRRAPAPRAVLVLDGPLPRPVAEALAGLALLTDPAALAGAEAPRALAHGEAALDLRAGADAAVDRLARRLAGWAWPLGLALTGAAAWAAAVAVDTARLRAQSAAIEAEVLAVAQARLLPPGPVVDLPLQVERALTARRAALGRAGALAVLRPAAVALAGQGLVPDRMAWAADVLTLELTVPGFAALDAAAAALAAEGLAVSRLRQAGGAAGAVAATFEVRPEGGR